MRLNQFLARHTDLSRRSADVAISEGRVEIDDILARLGDTVIDSDSVTLDGHKIIDRVKTQTIMLHKPVGYVCSRAGQGNKTIYDLLPAELKHLNPVGRLDKDSSGLILLTNDGELANQLTHPRNKKAKRYEVNLDKPLPPLHQQIISNTGIELEDGVSQLKLRPLNKSRVQWEVIMHEGRNRQIRRTFDTLGYKVTNLHRTNFGEYRLQKLAYGEYITQ
ncbi:MAG: rRNA pseudouridine synthase [bacterium]|nr:rRNA pseudouridine synthase [bacterium]